MAKAVIFGAGGQDGYYLSMLLEQKGIMVFKVTKNDENRDLEITNAAAVTSFIRTEQPDYVFHFSASSSTKHEHLAVNHAIIATGTINILEAVRAHSPKTKVFITGSGLQFRNENLPIKETDPFAVNDAYSLARVESVYAARYFRDAFGLKVYVGYLFNHDSPRRKPQHMSQKIVHFLKETIAGTHQKIEIGDLTAKKEWGFAGDIVEGIWTLINQDDVFEATIGTGKAYSIKDWLDVCFHFRNLNWEKHVLPLEGYTSPYKILVSEPTTIFQLGWQPKVSFEQLSHMMINETNEKTK
jgi:GDPmannose 4,6-dehydratase